MGLKKKLIAGLLGSAALLLTAGLSQAAPRLLSYRGTDLF